jgi:hypothetical protein
MDARGTFCQTRKNKFLLTASMYGGNYLRFLNCCTALLTILSCHFDGQKLTSMTFKKITKVSSLVRRKKNGGNGFNTAVRNRIKAGAGV